MPEATEVQLEQKRFVINPESLEAMKRVRDSLPELQEQFPFLLGVSFFGSRTKGKEKAGSDLDLRIFYDKSRSNELSSTLGGHVPAAPYISREKKAEMQGRIREISGLNLDSHDGILVNISKENTDKQIRLFSEYVSKYINKNITGDVLDDISSIPPGQSLYAQFFLAVGDGVYKNRAYILDQFKQMPHGDEYFKILMRSLARMERGGNRKYSTPEYDRIPEAIKEAERYFVTRQDLVEVGESPKTA